METISPTKSTGTKSFFQSIGYSKRFRMDVHTLLAFGYEQARSTLNTNTQEPTITGRIAEEIDKGLQKVGLLPAAVLKPHYVVIPEHSKINSKDPNNVKDTFLRLDIVILNNRKIPYRSYVVEGKRLKKKKFSQAIDKYCHEGIMRFINEIYASNSPEAIMVGFWQDENAKHWFDELTGRFGTEEKIMFVEEKLTSLKVIPEISDEWVSSHQRKSGSRILLFHILLNCL